MTALLQSQLCLESSLQQNRDLKRKLRQAQGQCHLLIEEKADLQAQVHDLSQEVISLKKHLGEAVKDNVELSKKRADEESSFIDTVNRPKFSLIELRTILIERNELKARVNELEDELIHLRRMSKQHKHQDNWKKKSTGRGSDVSLSAAAEELEQGEDVLSSPDSPSPPTTLRPLEDSSSESTDLPVQGPINREPDDKLYPGRKASILRL